jgi:hypothetical protein
MCKGGSRTAPTPEPRNLGLLFRNPKSAFRIFPAFIEIPPPLC